jgi:hypothetical protein
MAVLNTDTFSTYTDLVSGKFLISGLTTGTYKILFDAEAPLRDTVLNNVAVQNGQITNIGLLDVQ